MMIEFSLEAQLACTVGTTRKALNYSEIYKFHDILIEELRKRTDENDNIWLYFEPQFYYGASSDYYYRNFMEKYEFDPKYSNDFLDEMVKDEIKKVKKQFTGKIADVFDIVMKKYRKLVK